MKLAGDKARAFFKKPDPGKALILIYGADAMRVALRRQEVIKALVGETAEEEMRLDRMMGSDLRSDPARLVDAIRAQGFFPGPRVVFVEEANDLIAAGLEAALTDWAEGDATLVVTAGALKASAKLRKLAETAQNAVSIGIYDDPPSRAEVEALLIKAGLTVPDKGPMDDLLALSRDLDPGDFAQTVEKLALFMHSADAPMRAEDIAAVAPATSEAGVDDLINMVAEAKTSELGPMMKRLIGQGLAATTMCIMAERHFRTLHGAVSHPKGAEAALAAARPPVFGPRRDRMARQVRSWGQPKLEQALKELMNTDLLLRSSGNAPDLAVLERTFIRIAMMRPR